jgi:hypothetical protein
VLTPADVFTHSFTPRLLPRQTEIFAGVQAPTIAHWHELSTVPGPTQGDAEPKPAP